MNVDFVLAGRLSREYILPPFVPPLLDMPGGSLLYAAGGLALWAKKIGLLARVSADYPPEWVEKFKARGLDTRGIKFLSENLDQRSFIAYTDTYERSQTNPVAHFAKRGMTFPKSLLGYQLPAMMDEDPRKVEPSSPSPRDLPKAYHKARAIHLCPLDFASQEQLMSALKGGSTILSLDPAPGAMNPSFWRDLRISLKNITIFHASEEELRSLFREETHDLWEMAQSLCDYGCEIVVIKRGGHGQYIYEKMGKRKWEAPAYPSRVADPTGAGDAFCGGYLAGFLKTNDPLQAALYGNVSASLNVEGSGPFYSLDVLPGLAEARLRAVKELVREA